MNPVNGKSNKLVNPEIDAILGIQFHVLNDGFIRVVDYMGSDESIVQAARVSYGKGTKKLHEDRGLIRYLMRHRHTSPFEMCEIKLHLRVPMDCWRQWIRHRTANVNEYSTRYSVAINQAQTTSPEEWRMQAVSNRQGSAGIIDTKIGRQLTKDEQELQEKSRQVYEDRLEKGVAREQARKDLTLSTYTEAYWKIDLHNLLHFLSLRMDSKAQYEIRQYANIIGHEIVSKWCPLTWQAFLDYRFNSLNLSSFDTDIIRELIKGNNEKAVEICLEKELLKVRKSKTVFTLEGKELQVKLDRLGLELINS